MTTQELGEKLRKLHNNAPAKTQMAHVVLFGIAFGDKFKKSQVEEIVTLSKLQKNSKKSFIPEVTRGRCLRTRGFVAITKEGEEHILCLIKKNAPE